MAVAVINRASLAAESRRPSTLPADSVLRRSLVAVGLLIWIAGLFVLVADNYALGGAMIAGGGLCLVVAAAGGLDTAG
jgi:hypothetical protein